MCTVILFGTEANRYGSSRNNRLSSDPISDSRVDALLYIHVARQAMSIANNTPAAVCSAMEQDAARIMTPGVASVRVGKLAMKHITRVVPR